MENPKDDNSAEPFSDPANAGAWNIFNEYFPVATTKPLFHYTSLTVFQNILDTGTIWATESRYLNDHSEATYGEAIIESAITSAKDNYTPAVRHMVEGIPNGLREIGGRHDAFFASFSEDGDLLNQWVAYTPAAAGVAVGVEGAYLSDRFHLRRILYNSQQQSEFVLRVLSHCASEMESAVESGDGERLVLAAANLGILLQIALLCMKNPAFEVEHEWRVIVHQPKGESKRTVKYRAAASMLVPYVELPLQRSGTNQPAVAEVVVGPALDFQLNAPSIKAFASSKGVHLQPQASRVPFRSVR